MKENICICIVCLKTFSTSTTNATAASPQQIEKCGVSLLTKFLKFAKNFLQIPSQKLPNVNDCASEKVTCSDAFCEKCELAVITPICQVYLEFLSAQLRLSWELEQLGKLLESSPIEKFDNDNKLGVVNIITLTEQLGIESVSHLEEFRSLLSKKCKLKRKLALPDVLIGPRCEHEDDVDHYVFEPLDSEGASNPIDFKLQVVGDSPRQDNDGFIELESVAIKLESLDLPNDDHYILPENKHGKQDDDNDDNNSNSGVLDELLKCSKCGSQFVTQFALDRHRHCHTDDVRNQLKFEEVIVPEPFTDESEIEHPNGAYTPTPGGNSVATISGKRFNYNKRKHFSCSQCKRVFSESDTLRNHFIAKHNPQTHVCSQCSKSFATMKYLKNHCAKVHSQPSFSCSQCGAVYTTNWSLKCHIKAVHNPEAHVCVECNKVFPRIGSLKIHCKNAHPQPGQEFKCPICAKGFATRYKMFNHKRCRHSTKSFSCPQCSAVYNTNWSLKCHIKAVHNPETHVCVECKKVFPTIEYMKVHCRKVHPQPGQQEFKCIICAKGFATKYKMVTHKRRHYIQNPKSLS